MDRREFPECEEDKAIEVTESDGMTEVHVRGQPYMRWQSEDEASQRVAIVQLYDHGLGSQEMLAEVFKLSVRSIHRYVTDFARDEVRGLVTQQAGPRTRWKITPRLRAKILTIVLQERIFKLESIRKRLETDVFGSVGTGGL